MKKKIFIGINSIEKANEIIKSVNASSVLLVTGKQSYISSNAKSKLDKILSNIYTKIFNKFEVNPKIEDVFTG